MALKGKIVSTLLVIDTFLLSYAFGFNSRHVMVEDPALPPYVAPETTKVLPSKPTLSAKAKPDAKADKSDSKSATTATTTDKKVVKSSSNGGTAAKTQAPKSQSSKKGAAPATKAKQTDHAAE